MPTLDISNSPTLAAPSLEALFRRASGFMASGVAVIWNPDVVMTVSTLHGVSFDPPWVSVSLDRSSRKAASIIEGRRFRARILRADEESLTRADAVAAHGGLADLECHIRAVHPVGDHELVLAEVEDAVIRGGDPLIYWRRGLHPFKPRYPFLETPDAFRRFVETWEEGALPKAAWSHAAHVAVGACYAIRYGADAMDHLRHGIKKHNAAVGTVDSSRNGYHETLTRFWFDLVSTVTAGAVDPWLAAFHAVERLGEERDLHRLYYSFDVVNDTRARATWVPPDLAGPF